MLKTLKGHDWRVTALAICPNGRLLISGSYDSTVKVWDLDGPEAFQSSESHLREITCISVSPDGQRVISASREEAVKVWDQETSNVQMILKLGDECVRNVAISPDARRVVGASTDHTLKLWDLETGALLRTVEDSAAAVVFLPGGLEFASVGGYRRLRIWDLGTGRLLRTVGGEGPGHIVSVAVHPNGLEVLAVSEESNTVNLGLCNLDTGKWTFMMNPADLEIDNNQSPELSDLDSELDGNENDYRFFEKCSRLAVICPDGRRAVSATHQKAQGLRLWSLETGQLLRIFEGSSSTVLSIAISPDGRRLASSERDRKIKIWDLETGAKVASFECDGEPLRCAFIDSSRLVAGDTLGHLHWVELVE